MLMGFNNLCDEGLFELARAIGSSNSIIAVDFTQNSLTPRCAGALFNMISTNESLVSFKIGSYKGPERNRLGHEGCFAIADALRQKRCLIQHLDLKSTLIDSQDVHNLATAMEDYEFLETIDLQRNRINGV